MTSEFFQKDSVRQTELSALLSHPVLQEALTLLKEELEPKATDLTQTNPVVASAKYHQMAGVNHILQGLGRLTQPYKAPAKISHRTLISDANDVP